MQEIFIEVHKIATKHKRDENGDQIKDPITQKPINDGFEVHVESIRIDEIRSYRIWNKTKDQEVYIDGEITKLYLKGSDDSRKKKPEMLINESYDSFAGRLKTIRMNHVEV